MSEPWGTVDSNILCLVEALNELPGIDTFASCGGHKDPSQTQQPEGKWFIGFNADGPEGLHRLVDVLATMQPAISDYYLELRVERIRNLKVQCSLNGDTIPPWRVARLIREVRHERAGA